MTVIVHQEDYRKLRAQEYPPLSDLADAMVWAAKGDTSKMENYVAICEEVKLKYPKPSNNAE